MREVLKADITSPSPLLILVFIDYNAHMIASKQNKDLVCKGRGFVFFNISVPLHADSIPLQNYSHNHQDVPLLKAQMSVCSWTDFEYGWNQRLSTADFRAKLDSGVHNKLSSVAIITQKKHLMQIYHRPLKYPTVQAPFAPALPLSDSNTFPFCCCWSRVLLLFKIRLTYLAEVQHSSGFPFLLGVRWLNLRDIAKFAPSGCAP